MLKRIAQNHPPAIAQLGVTFAREKHVFNHQLKIHTANRVASSFSLPPHAHHVRGCKQHMRSWPVFRSFYTCLSQTGKTCHSWIMARSVVVGGKIRNLPSSCKTAPKHHHLSATRFDALSVKQAQEWEIKVSTPSGRCAIWLDRLVCTILYSVPGGCFSHCSQSINRSSPTTVFAGLHVSQNTLFYWWVQRFSKCFPLLIRLIST